MTGQVYDRIAFYNVENFFDTEKDTTRRFNGFTPNGDHHWTGSRYRLKQQHIFKVLTALGGWNGLTIIGLAEVENKKVLEDLLTKTPLKKMGYEIIHFDSPDKRGIDLGAFYLKNRFHLLKARNIAVKNPKDPYFTTRDILYVKGIIEGDTVHLFFNHWPSRYGGMMNTVKLRLLAAQRLSLLIDSLKKVDSSPKIVVLGDFNDNQSDKSIQYLLKREQDVLSTLPYHFDFGLAKGTIKHHADWSVFDQIMVSQNLLKLKGLHVADGKLHIFDNGFLLENDLKFQGVKLNRTFVGFRYHGGFSDHLPVYIDLTK